jgi:L-malate glycosyltransferase
VKEDELQAKTAVNRDLNGNPKQFLDFRLLSRLVTLIREFNPDVIQANGSDTLKYLVFANRFVNARPIVYRNISMISSWMGKNLVKKFLYRFLFRHVHHVTSVGHAALSDFLVTMKYPAHKASVIRRGIPNHSVDHDAARKQIMSEFLLDPNDKIVSHVGNFSREKNHDFIVKVFSQIKSTRDDIKLILAGSGKLFHEIQQRDNLSCWL